MMDDLESIISRRTELIDRNALRDKLHSWYAKNPAPLHLSTQGPVLKTFPPYPLEHIKAQ